MFQSPRKKTVEANMRGRRNGNSTKERLLPQAKTSLSYKNGPRVKLISSNSESDLSFLKY